MRLGPTRQESVSHGLTPLRARRGPTRVASPARVRPAPDHPLHVRTLLH